LTPGVPVRTVVAVRSLLIDNYDSYTYNLFQLMAGTFGVRPTVLTNDVLDRDLIDPRDFDAVVISPGPGRPQNPADVGGCLELLLDWRLPVLGVCMGHQILAVASGADVVAAPVPRHGFLERVRHDGQGLFRGIPQGFTAVRYHSLCVGEPLPDGLEATAWAHDGVIMGLRERERQWWGVQFHPESVATEHGARLMRNFADLVPHRRKATVRTSARPPRPASVAQQGKWRLLYERIDTEINTEQAFSDLFGTSEYSFWLDSSRVMAGYSRFSFLGDSGGPYAEVLTASVTTATVRIQDAGGEPTDIAGTIFDVLAERLSRTTVEIPTELPFDLGCGYVGYLGYELKAQNGSANRHVSPHPDAVWMAASRLVAVDHESGITWIVALWDGHPGRRAAVSGWLAETRDRLTASGTDAAALRVPGTIVEPEPWLDRSRARYLADIDECQRQLRMGESYEICLTNTVERPFDGDPLDLYRRIRRSNPAPYAAYLRLGELHVLCSSPERFLKVGRDRVAEAKPIKGTTPRHPDPVRDAALSAELALDLKTRAENLMIVDLLRNDLGRVCEVGSVRVPRFMAVESYATVHQLVSTVRGRLRDDVSAVSAVRACFPGGSMTGAPKLRTMEIIDRLERRARGVYSGAIGFFGLSGTADLNIVIRTAVISDGQLTVGAGGAIVLDSDTEDEYDEMLLKARTVLRDVPERAPARSATGDGDLLSGPLRAVWGHGPAAILGVGAGQGWQGWGFDDG
jgi:para-aminobenzoate synthetase